MKSWKTTIGGILAAAGAGLSAMSGFEELGAALTAIGIAIIGVSARDNSVTSRQAGAE